MLGGHKRGRSKPDNEKKKTERKVEFNIVIASCIPMIQDSSVSEIGT